MTPLVYEWIYSLRKELDLHKGKAAILAAAVTLVVLVLGFVWPKTYQSSAILHADDQNVIKPLLAGQAEVPRLEADQLEIVRERLSSPAVLGQALLDSKQVVKLDDSSGTDPRIRALQAGITVESSGKNYIKISYKSRDQKTALEVTSAVVNAFINDSAKSRRQESRDAFVFIDNQVKTYKSQLEQAEEKLKNFKMENPGGSDVSASTRISGLRSSLESLNLDLQVARSRRDGLAQQLSHESQSITRQYKSDVYRDALIKAQSRLDTLRLSYQETYPDIVALKQQIEDLNQSISRSQSEPSNDSSQLSSANPVYQKLKSDIAEAEVAVRTLQLRIDSANKLLNEEHGQSKENAEYQASMAELNRDYTVTKTIYEDMLERREKARLSVALDVQGQGISYKIKEPPVLPRFPVGLRFVHFFLAAPAIGFLAPILLLIAYIQLDPRIRFSERLHSGLPESVPVLAIIPHFDTNFEKTMAKSEWGSIVILAGVVLVIYVAAGVARLSGVL